MAAVNPGAPASEKAIRPAYCDKDDLRETFCLAMSTMYKAEVPLYSDLIQITRNVNDAITGDDNVIFGNRLDLERHGAIRLGTPAELWIVRRIFAQIGLFPVDYYDLSVAGIPMHATAFRPVDPKALEKNPFRVFTTLLRPELLSDEARVLALSLLDRRKIFSDELLHLLDVGETQDGFTCQQAERFIVEAMETFRWKSLAAASHEEYQKLSAEHPILADVACFNSAHLNHLTPRVLDIDIADARMRQEGLAVKTKIEGPPPRRIPILLRQTSFLALQEPIKFRNGDGWIDGSHKARFGEIEQRGIAMTAKGRDLYDRVLSEALRANHAEPQSMKLFSKAFEDIPDDLDTLINRGLVFCTFQCTGKKLKNTVQGEFEVPLSTLLQGGVVEATPIVYEDFLPFSAAGIFRSNLGGPDRDTEEPNLEPFGNREGLEHALKCPVLDSLALYAREQTESLDQCAQQLGVQQIVIGEQFHSNFLVRFD